MISIIAAIGKNRELGRKGELIFHIKEDMKFFKETTTGHPVVMGRKTFEEIGRALPGRTNFVVTRKPDYLPNTVEPIHNLKHFLEAYSGEDTPEVFVIGGGMVYFEALPYAEKLYLTEVDAKVPDADTFFPIFDKSLYERVEIKKGKEDDLTFTISKYEKK